VQLLLPFLFIKENTQMTDMPKWWAELTKLYAFVENHPDDYSDALVDRIIVLEDFIADTPPANIWDAYIKLCVVMHQLGYEGGATTPHSLNHRLIYSVAHALAPTGLN
jgi:hypothetical protein